MKIHNVKQGTPEWKQLRGMFRNASDASVMMGAKGSRAELVKLHATSTEKEFSDWVQRNLLDKGHGVEAKANPIAVEIMGVKALYPVVGSGDDGTPDEKLQASFDGLTANGRMWWECKMWNESKAEYVLNGQVPPEDYWQMVQQAVVCKGERGLYMVTDGTPEKTVSLWFDPSLHQESIEKLRMGWEQFERDVEAYNPAAQVEKVTAAPVDRLPALTYRVDGLTVHSNLAAFRQEAIARIELASLPLQTDQDFADREALCKSFGEAEKKIDLIVEQVMGEFASVDEFRRELQQIQEMLRRARLDGEKQVTRRKTEIKEEISKAAMDFYLDGVDFIRREQKERFGRTFGIFAAPDIAAAIKGKRTVDTLREAASKAARDALMDAQLSAKKIAEAVEIIHRLAKGYEFLVADMDNLVSKDHEVIGLTIQQRIRDYEAQQVAARQAAEAAAQYQAAQQAAEAAGVTQAPEPVYTPAPETVAHQAFAPVDGCVNYESAPSHHIDALVNALSDLPAPNDELIAFYDTETTGLPDYGTPSDAPHQPHLVEIAVALFTRSGRLVKTYSQLVRPDDWLISNEIAELTGVTQDIAREHGADELCVLNEAISVLASAGERNAFNASFDERILRIALSRYQGKDIADEFKAHATVSCSMHMAAKKINGEKGRKTVKLATAYQEILGKELVNAHSALADTLAAAEIYFALNGRQ